MTTGPAGELFAAVCPRVGGWPSANNSDKLILPEDTEVRTDGSRMIEIDGGYHVWTKKIGDAPIKVLLLHGGPGLDHTYFECFEDFFTPNGIEFYYYDQLDSTNSDKPGDPRLWTVERFCHEVEAVRKGLELEQFYLLGHSWGGMLGIEYALAYSQLPKIRRVMCSWAASPINLLVRSWRLYAENSLLASNCRLQPTVPLALNFLESFCSRSRSAVRRWRHWVES